MERLERHRQLGYSSDMSSWVTSVNSIPTLAAPLNGISIKNVAVSWHAYDFNSEQSQCPSQYNSYMGSCTTGEATATATSVTAVLSAGLGAGFGIDRSRNTEPCGSPK